MTLLPNDGMIELAAESLFLADPRVFNTQPPAEMDDAQALGRRVLDDAFAALDRDALIEAADTALNRQGYWMGDRRRLAEAVLRAVGLIA